MNRTKLASLVVATSLAVAIWSTGHPAQNALGAAQASPVNVELINCTVTIPANMRSLGCGPADLTQSRELGLYVACAGGDCSSVPAKIGRGGVLLPVVIPAIGNGIGGVYADLQGPRGGTIDVLFDNPTAAPVTLVVQLWSRNQ